MGSQSSTYNHFFPPAANKGDYPEKYKFTLVDSLDHLESIFKEHKDSPEIAIDTETTSLDHRTALMVGYSFSYDGIEGFYVPSAHSTGNINNPILANKWLGQHLVGKRAFFYNKRYDLRILSGAGIDITTFTHFDVAVLVWLADTNVKMPTLKWAEKHFLGWDAPTFDELFEDGNVQLTRPIDALQYAATDAIGPLRLFKRLIQLMPGISAIARLDNRNLDVIKEIEETPLLIDVPYLRSILPDLEKRLTDLQFSLYEMAGRTYNPGSGEQVAQILVENGCAPKERTPKGKISTSAKHLQRIDHPIVKAQLEWKGLQNLRDSYINKLINESSQRKNSIHVNHLTFNVPTGRLSTGSDRKNAFFSRVNIQSITKPNPGFFKPKKIGDFEKGVLGYEFEQCKEGEPGSLEGYDPKLNVRRAVVAPPGFMWVSIDYKAEELRLPANFSKEPVFVKAFTSGKDIHTEVAKKVFGEPINQKVRKICKFLNFGLMYLGNKYTVQNQIGCSLEEAERYKSDYESAHKTLYLWKDAVIRAGKRNGFVLTYYGRPRRLRNWFSSKNWRDVAFAKRSAVNSVVQGTGADLLKLACIRILDKMYRSQKVILSNLPEDYSDIDFLFHPLVHDEINFLVRISKIYEIVPQIMELMTIQEKDWPVPMEVEVSFGPNWGTLYPFKLQEGEFIPETSD